MTMIAQRINQDALKRMHMARSVILIDHPFFGCLLMHLKLREATFIDTMAVDGTYLYYNPDFVMKQHELHLIGICIHEAYHCAYRHHVRMGGRDLKDWNKAADYRINFDLKLLRVSLPSWVLYDATFADMTTEEAYDVIHQQQPPQGGGGGQGEQGGQKPDKQGQQPQSGNGKQPGGAGAGQPQFEAPDPGGMGGVISPVPEWDKNAIEAENARWESITRQAINVARAQNAGQVPGFLERLVKELDRSRVDWKTTFRNFVDDSVEKMYSFTTPNKRYIHIGLLLPGLRTDGMKHLVAFMDTSGSVTDKLTNMYASEVTAFLDEGLADKVTVIYTDTVVQHVEVFERGDEVKLNPKGGGGTNFRPAFEYAAEYCSDASVMVFFTDLLTTDFGDDPGVPVLWAVYGKTSRYEYLAKKVPFGITLHIEE